MRTVVVTGGARYPALRRGVFVAVQAAVWAAFGAGVVIATLVVAPRPLGLESFSVLSGSMQPTLGIGDLVVDQRIGPADARVGDVVTFRDPERPARLITHRVVSYRFTGKAAHFVTRGDRNPSTESWSIPLDGTLGRAAFRVPLLGYALAWTGGPVGRWLLLVVPALLLAVIELKRIWLPRRRA